MFIGQAFNFSRQHHVCDPMPIPAGAQIYMTFDWGFGAPFSIGWWWVDADGRIYRFMEWYGWNGQPNQGLRITDQEVVKGILEREKSAEIDSTQVMRLAGPDCFQKRPNYMGGGQGPSTAEVFAMYQLYLTVGDANRQLKIRAFRERMKIPDDGTRPMMQIYSTCTQFIRTVPNLVVDQRNIEDIDTSAEDHIYDESCHICMARPIALEDPGERLYRTEAQRDWDVILGKEGANASHVIDDYGL